MVAGMVYGDDTGENREAKSYTYKKVQEIAAEFKKTNPSIICRELLGLSKNCAVTPNAEKRTAEYYKKRPCAQIVEDAVKATEKCFSRISAPIKHNCKMKKEMFYE